VAPLAQLEGAEGPGLGQAGSSVRKVLIAAVLAAVLAVAAPRGLADLRVATLKTPVCDTPCLQARVARLERRVVRINRRSVRLERERNDLRRTLMHRPDVIEAIKLASVAYGVSTTWMLSRGSCESTGGHGHNPKAVNSRSKAAGEFQFLWSTWRSTPFAAFSPFSPYANALAAGWMMGPAHRAREWVCR
jgi:hypothetical protein